MTERLYLTDTNLLDFDAALVDVTEHAGRPALVLDRSAFYPESGGQLGDRGVLTVEGAELLVVDTQADADGRVLHLLDSAFSEAFPGDTRPDGVRVEGRVDRLRRRAQTTQHSAQHMLSGAFADLFGAETVSARLGERSGTIDLGIAELTPTQLDDAEGRVCDAVLEDRAIRVLFPSPAELADLPLRAAPKVTEGIRIIQVADFDTTPCGGTHCERTGEIGPVRILGTERRKEVLRIRFAAAHEALADYRDKDRLLNELATGFSCGPLDVAVNVRKLQAGLKDAQQALGKTRAELAELLVQQLDGAHPPAAGPFTPVLALREHDDARTISAICRKLTEARPDIAVLALCRDPDSGDWSFVAQRGAAAELDIGARVRAFLAEHGGRGGGKADRAQGRLNGALDSATLEGFFELP